MIFMTILALSAFMMALTGTRLTLLVLIRRAQILSVPVLRGEKPPPPPTGGGLAVVMTLIICLLVADMHYAIALSLFLLAAVTLIDSLISVPAAVRFLVQVIAVIIAIIMLPAPVFGGLFPLWFDRILTAILWLWFINLFSFMDGIDGLAASEMICIGMGLCLIAVLTDVFSDALSSYSLIVAAGACGFLWWNWHPAKIRLGEVGSIPIGFLLGYLLVLASLAGYGAAALILPAYYLADGAISVLCRLWQRLRGRPGTVDSYFQMAVRRGWRPDMVARTIFGINWLLVLPATLSVINPDLAIVYLGVAYMAVFMLLGFFAHTEHNPHHESH